MKPSDIFINSAGRLRSGWRFLIFIIVAYLLASLLFGIVTFALHQALGRAAADQFLAGNWGHLLQSVLLLLIGLLAGWGCGRWLEGLPASALGWGRHRGWLRDFLMGSGVGIASLLVAVALATLLGGFRFAFDISGNVSATGQTLVLSLFFFIIAAAGEETLFRGYPLQTMTRAHLAWVAILITAALFAQAHLNNPNVEGWGFLQTPAGGMFRKIGWGFMNTTLAGVWLAVAYLRTRSLWFPLGIHWSWNWMMGAVLGLPVSGIERLAPSPLMRVTDAGPAWLTGGAYGVEGGAACTVALIVSTIFIWRSRLVAATPEMLELTDNENPKERPFPSYPPLPQSHQPPTSNRS
ncbi:MAG: CPBP family intramembrane glutamic endopeptidase [Pyrinomonadaceae bacterium]